MRHTAVPAYDEKPCGGRIIAIPVAGAAAVPIEALPPPPANLPTYQKPTGRSLPILGAVVSAGTAPPRPPGVDELPDLPIFHFRCEGCGKEWDTEPLPDEAI